MNGHLWDGLANTNLQISDEVQKLKYKEPGSPKLVTLEQELVRAEAQSLVAEAQLTNITRQKFKEAYDLHTAAVIERAEKQIMLAQQARRLINLLDDTPIVPGEERAPVSREYEEAAREVLNDAELGLKNWTSNVQPIHSTAGQMGSNAMPDAIEHTATSAPVMQQAEQNVHGAGLAHGSGLTHGTEQYQQQPLQHETQQVGSTQAPYPSSIREEENVGMAA